MSPAERSASCCPSLSRLPPVCRALLANAGLAAIVAAALLYSADTPYPSWRAVLPVFGATAVILGGIAAPKAPAVRLLAAPPMVWIGLFSYSWYLWHWPLLALARIVNFGERNFAFDAGLALVSLGLAAATYFWSSGRSDSGAATRQAASAGDRCLWP